MENSNKKVLLGALAFVAVFTAVLVRHGAIADSMPAGGSVVNISMPAAQALNLSVSDKAQLSGIPASDEMSLGGLVHNTQETFDAGIAVGGTQVISSARAITGAASITIGSGTSIDKYLSTSSSINADSIVTGQSTSSVISLSGVSAGDTVSVGLTGDWSAPSSSVRVIGVPSADAVTLYFYNTTGTSVNLTPSTYIVDVVSH